MEEIEWNEHLEIGNVEIDSQHMLFVGIINKISNKVKEGADKHIVELLLNELLKYSEFHFCSEENIMIENNFPDLLEHKHEHEKVLAELRNRLFSLKYDFIDFEQLNDFLISWFKGHTTKTDSKLAQFLA